MTARRYEDNPEARRLRDAIAADLIILRQTFSRRGAGIPAMAGVDIPEQVGRMLRSNPVWAAAAAAGALAGMWVGARNRFRRTPV